MAQPAVNVASALAYLNAIKAAFDGQPEKYQSFLNVMDDFRSARVDVSNVLSRVIVLFSGHPDLILGFNTFVPPGYHVEFVEGEDEPRIITPNTN